MTVRQYVDQLEIGHYVRPKQLGGTNAISFGYGACRGDI